MTLQAIREDIADICSLERENMPSPYTQRQVEDLFDNPRVTILKIVKDNKIAAYLSAETVFDEASINNVVVDREFRRRGLGTRLIAELNENLRQRGVKKVFLEVASRNLPAIRLYQSCSFKEISRRKGYYGDDDAIIMELNF